jgi:tyrosyl-tRNA synthetase
MASEAIPPALVVDGRVYLPKLLAELGLAESASRARGLLEQGGVRLDGERQIELDAPIERLRGAVIQVGRRRFVRLA